jgi:FecR-like protein
VRRGDSVARPSTGRRRARAHPGLRLAAAAIVALASVAALSAPAVATPSAKNSTKSQSKAALATLKVQTAQVTIKKKGKSSYVAAKDGQTLEQGDSLKTDTTGTAEIDYTDGSLTRLGNSTEFTITKLTDKRGGRQTQGTLSVGETWNRAAKVSETGSFEVKAGGTTAAVEGTAFAVVCVNDAGKLTCTFTDVVDNVKVTTADGAAAQLEPAKSVVVTQGDLGTINTLTYDQLSNNVFIAGNLALDLQAGKGQGLLDLPQPPTGNAAGPGGTGGRGGAAPTVAGGDTTGQVTVAGAFVAREQYPPSAGMVVDDPNVEVAGESAFRGAGCVPNEVLQVLFDHVPIGTVASNSQGSFAGTITIPPGTKPGVHLLTVRGAVCVLNANITVRGGAVRLAFTGSSSHTSTYVLGGIAAVVVGLMLVVGTRRRRRGLQGRSFPPSSTA